jgi:hypothetical protein
MQDQEQTNKKPTQELIDLRNLAEANIPADIAIPDASTLSAEELQKLVHELRVHRIELEM